MDERREKGLCSNCDNKYSKGHKIGEKQLFYIDCAEKEANEHEPYQAEEKKWLLLKRLLPPYLVMHWIELEPLKLSILKGISKNKRVIVLIDLGVVRVNEGEIMRSWERFISVLGSYSYCQWFFLCVVIWGLDMCAKMFLIHS